MLKESCFLRILHKFAVYLVLIPPYLDNKSQLILYKCYNILITTVILIIFTVSAYYTIAVSSMKESFSTYLVYFATQTLTTASTIAGNLSSLLNINNFRLFKKLFFKVDEYLNITERSEDCNIFYPVGFLLTNIYICSLITFDLHTTITSYGMAMFYKYIFLELQQYLNLVLVFIIHNYCNCVKKRHKLLQCNLSVLVEAYTKKTSCEISASIVEKIRNVKRSFKLLSIIVDLFNKIFGWQILFFYASVVALILEAINIILDGRMKLEIKEFFLTLLWIAIKMVSASFQTF